MPMKMIRKMMSGETRFKGVRRAMVIWFFQCDYKARIALKAALDEGASAYVTINEMVFGE